MQRISQTPYSDSGEFSECKISARISMMRADGGDGSSVVGKQNHVRKRIGLTLEPLCNPIAGLAFGGNCSLGLFPGELVNVGCRCGRTLRGEPWQGRERVARCRLRGSLGFLTIVVVSADSIGVHIGSCCPGPPRWSGGRWRWEAVMDGGRQRFRRRQHFQLLAIFVPPFQHMPPYLLARVKFRFITPLQSL